MTISQRCTIAVLVGLLAVAAWGIWRTNGHTAVAGAPNPARVLPLDLPPGHAEAFEIAGYDFTLEVPAGEAESHSIGTFVLRSHDSNFDSGPCTRDGSLESMHLADLNADGVEDALLTLRSAGSGGYVNQFLLQSTADGFRMDPLPALEGALAADYEGHDAVAVEDGVVLRCFPTASNPERRVRFDLAAWAWTDE